MKKIKKMLASLMVAVVILTAAPLSGFVGMEFNLDWINFDWLNFNTKASAAEYSGACGPFKQASYGGWYTDSVKWHLDTTEGVLVISGSGSMAAFGLIGNVSYEPTWKPYSHYIKTVIIEDGVTNIGSYAFEGLSKLKNIEIPESVRSIGAGAFKGCTGLTSFEIPNGISHINEQVFMNCTGLESVIIPNSVVEIWSSAFYNCTALVRAIFNGTIDEYLDVTFVSPSYSALNSEIRSLIIINKGTDRPYYVSGGSTWTLYADGELVIYEKMWDYTSLKNVPWYIIRSQINTVTIGPNVNEDFCRSIYKSWDYVTAFNVSAENKLFSSDEHGVLFNKDKTRIIKYPSGKDNSNYIIPDGTKAIDQYSFESCAELKSILIPSDVTFIGSGAIDSGILLFYIGTKEQLDNLSTETNKEQIKICEYYGNCGKDIGWYIANTGTIYVVGNGTMNNYSSTASAPWDAYRSEIKKLVVGDGVTSIGNDTFFSCKNLTSISFPDSVTKIGNTAFRDCIALKDVNLNKVENLGYYAFYGCVGLVSVDFGTAMTTVNKYAFKKCSSLFLVTVTETVTTVAKEAFDDCESLEITDYKGTEQEWSTISIDTGNEALTNSRKKVTASGSCGEGVYWCLAEEGNLTVFGNGEMDDYTYSSTSTSPYYKVDSPWFNYRSSIKTITIRDGVKNIGANAFYNFDNITVLTLNDSVNTISDSAFYNCDGLTELYIPSGINHVSDDAFYGSSNLSSITIADEACGIESGAFGNTAYSNDSSNWENNVLYIGKHLIAAKVALSGEYTIKSGTVSIASRAFISCKHLTGIHIPSSLINFGVDAFSSCTALKSVYYDGDVAGWCKINFADSDANPMYYATSLYIDGMAISGELKIPEGVTSVGGFAFYNCNKIISVTVPSTLKTVGVAAFYNCSDIKNTYYTGTKTQWNDITIGINNDYFTKTVVYDSNSEKPYYSSGLCGENLTYVLYTDGSLVISGTGDMTDFENSTDSPWYNYYSSIKVVVFDGDITSIGNYAFNNCTGLTEITIPDSVTDIGSNAFYKCTKLKMVTVGNSVKIIANYAFGSCGSLTDVYFNGTVADWCSINFGNQYANPLVCGQNLYIDGKVVTELVIPEGVTNVNALAFNSCASITSVTFADSVTTIGLEAFKDCINLVDIKFGSALKTIGSSAFNNCSSLTEVVLPESVTYIYDSAFEKCSKLKDITISEGITSISGSTFASCVSLENVTIPSTITSIGSGAFSCCNAIKNVYYQGDIAGWCSITFKSTSANPLFSAEYLYIDSEPVENLVINGDVISISDYAFYYYSGLKSLVIGDCVETIGRSAFIGNTCLESLIIGDGIKEIEYGIFSGCTQLSNITLGKNITTIGEFAFDESAIKTIVIPDSVKFIDRYAFRCYNLASVTLGSGVKTIKENAFSGCSNLAITYYVGTVAQWSKISIGTNNNYLTKNVIYDCNSTRVRQDTGICGENLAWTLFADGELVIGGTGSMTDYSSESPAPWNTHKTLVKIVTIDNGVTTIGDYAFNGCSNLAKMMIPETVGSIGDSASLACSALTDIYYSGTDAEWNEMTIGSSNGYINNAEKHFEHTHNYNAVTVSQSNCLVTGKLKYGCDCGSISKYEETPLGGHNPSSWIITKSATTSAEGMKVKKCTVCSTVLESEVLPKLDPVCDYLKWTVSGDSIIITGFYSGLSGDVVLPESINGYDVTSITAKAFLNNSKITSIQIPSGVYYIGEAAFAYCRNLKSVTIPWGISSIDQSAFIGCTNLEEIKIYDDYYEEYTNDGLHFKTDDRGVLFKINRYSGDRIDVFYAPAKAVGEAYTIPDFATSSQNAAFADCKDFSLTLSDGFDIAYNSVFFQILSVNEFIASENSVNFSTIDGVLYSKDGKTLVKYPVDSDRQIYVVPDTVTSLASDSVFYVMEEEQELIMKYNLSYSFENIIKTPAHLTVHIPSDMSLNKFLIGPSHYCVTDYTQSEINAGNALVNEEIAYWTEYWDEIRYEYSSSSVEYKMYNNYVTCMKNAYGTFEVCEVNHTNPYPFCIVTGTANPTCTKDGYDKYRCTECGYSFTVVIEATGHNHNVVVTAPTCTKQGYTTYTCDCGDNYVSDYVDETGHSYSSEVTTPATHTTTGVMTYTCHCGDTYTETIAKIEKHNYNAVVTAPTCTKQGYTTYICECGDSYIADYVDANGQHNHIAEVTTPATHTSTGVMTYTCECGDSYTETIAKIEKHNYNAVVTAPTCTKQGYTTYTCECGDNYIDDYVDANGHSHTATVTAPTCEDKGYTTYACACGDTYVADYVNAKGHTAGEWVVLYPATATTSGLKTKYCKTCGAELETQTIPAYGKVSGVSVDNISMNYKDSTTITPYVSVDAGVRYTVSYSSSDNSVARVDEYGNVYAAGKGSATITVTVTDQFGNTVSDICDVNVNYTGLQWFIIIVLFGWIWY